ncbi:MAG: glycosyltransferase family 4 protein [Candidatus Heimdallarchaeaceae archaeon]
MKVIIPCTTRTAIGGGMSFINNITKGAEGLFRVNHGLHDCGSVVLVPAPTLVTRDDFKRFKKKCPVVLRVDGIPEDWRNRGTGWPRLRDYAKWSDEVIYQSEFVRDTVGKLLNRKGVVIYNGIDTSVFKKEGPAMQMDLGKHSILYIHFRNDPNKRVDEVITRFRQYKLEHPDATITFVGAYPKNQFHWNGKNDCGMLDWQEGEDWNYLGVIKDRQELAKIMRSHQYIAFPSFADPCPNSLLEALNCGCEVLWPSDYGSTQEILDLWKKDYDFGLRKMTEEYYSVFKKLVIK